MPRAYGHSHLVNGRLVGFSVKKFAHIPTYVVCFRGPEGRRLQRDTNQARQSQAIEAARSFIEKEYIPPVPIAAKVTWEQIEKRLKTRFKSSGNRASTLGHYLKLIRLVKGSTVGPEVLSPSMAAAWRDRMMSTPGRGKKLRSAHYVAGALGGLSALWQKWFIDDFKVVAQNPWKEVKPPKTDRLPVKYATDEMIQHFYTWIADRFGDWSFPKLFLTTKAYTGCRLMDLCSLASGHLRDGRLIFPADLTKGREERRVPLSEDLFKALDAYKGETWLWEKYLSGLKEAIEKKGWPSHQLVNQFSPQRLYYWVETLFSDYRRFSKIRLTSHMFRKRAFTMAWQAGIDMRQASIAYGCNVDTLMKHYVAMDKQAVTDEVFARMHSNNSQTNGCQLKPKTA